MFAAPCLWLSPVSGTGDPGDHLWRNKQDGGGEEARFSNWNTGDLGPSMGIKSHWKSARLPREGDVLNWALKDE